MDNGLDNEPDYLHTLTYLNRQLQCDRRGIDRTALAVSAHLECLISEYQLMITKYSLRCRSTTEIPHTTTTAVPQSIDAPFSIYTISFQWYSLFGTLFVWLISVPLCHTIFPLDAPVEAHLVSPLLQWLVPGALAHSNARHVEMQLIGGDGKTKPLSGVVTESKYVVRQ